MDQPYTFRKVGHARHRRRPIALSWDKSAPDTALRKTGIGLLGEVPWGTHTCLFYETKQDLLDTAPPHGLPFGGVADQDRRHVHEGANLLHVVAPRE